MKKFLRRNYQQAVLPHVQRGVVDEERMWASTSIAGIDEYYNRLSIFLNYWFYIYHSRVHGHETLESYYRACSSIYSIDDVQVPIVFLNAHDDPIVPQVLYEAARRKVGTVALIKFYKIFSRFACEINYRNFSSIRHERAGVHSDEARRTPRIPRGTLAQPLVNNLARSINRGSRSLFHPHLWWR